MTTPGHRCCASLLPDYVEELPQGRRIGPLNRFGYEPTWSHNFDASGHPFPAGEHDSRIPLTVDGLPIKRPHDSRVPAFDESGAAGRGSPRTEMRSLTVDDSVCRARSCPPTAAAFRTASIRTMEAFGIGPDQFACGLRFRRRCLSPELRIETHSEAAKTAVRVGNIDCMLSKKHFHDYPSPGASLSPRLAAQKTEAVDIDIHPGRARQGTSIAAKGTLPRASASFEIDSPKSPVRCAPRKHALKYYEQTAEAESYAKLIGRPAAVTPKDIQATRLALEQLEKRARMPDTARGHTGSVGSIDLHSIIDSWSMVSSEPSSPLLTANRRMFRTLSAISTDASDCGSERHSVVEQTLSKVARALVGEGPGAAPDAPGHSSPEPSQSIFANMEDSEIKRVALDLAKENATSDIHSDEAFESEVAIKVPLGLRRVMASMMSKNDDLNDEIQAAIGSCAQQIQRFKDHPPTRTSYLRSSRQEAQNAARHPGKSLRQVQSEAVP